MKTVIYEHFKSLDHLIDTMNERPQNAVFQKTDLSSQRDESDKPRKFSGTNTYQEAVDVMQAGYKDPLEQMKKAILKIGRNEDRKRPRLKDDFVGFIPHVPNTLKNIPLTMINREKVQNKQKTIHLTYSFCSLGNVSTDDIIKGGINFISLVNSIEKQGYRVKIDTIFASVTDQTAVIYSVNLKNYGQALNLLKLAFPLVHPGMLRRMSFKYIETAPGLTDRRFIGGYGTTLGFTCGDSLEKERTWLKDHGIIKEDNNYYINAKEAIKAPNIEALAEKTGLIL